MTSRRGERMLNFDTLTVGEKFGPVVTSINEDLVKRFAYALDDYSPLYFDAVAPSAASPLILGNELLAIHYDTYARPARQNIQLKHSFTFHRLASVGERITIEGQLAGKYEKRGVQRFVVEATALGEDGTPIVGSVYVMGWPFGERVTRSVAKSAAASDAGSQSADAAAANGPAEGVTLPGVRKVVTQDRITAFTGASKLRSIHTNPDVARAAGLRGTIAQGIQSLGFICSGLVRSFGEYVFRGGYVEVAFLRPIAAADVVDVGGRIRSVTAAGAGRLRLDAEVWCRDAAGMLFTAGAAKITVPQETLAGVTNETAVSR
jgi:hypothetical protein